LSLAAGTAQYSSVCLLLLLPLPPPPPCTCSDNQRLWDKGQCLGAQSRLVVSDLSACCDKKRARDVLVVAIDGNASIGTKSSGDWGEAKPCVGNHGLPYVNPSGERMRNYMLTRELFALSELGMYGHTQHDLDA
jgi:hypothetical protein